MAKITLNFGSSRNLRRDVERLAARWSRERPDCNGREFTIELDEYEGVETNNSILNAVLTVELLAVIDERRHLIAGDYVYVVDASSFGAAVTEKEVESFCRRFEAKCTVTEGDDVSIGACLPQRDQAPGLYERRGGRFQLLGGSIPVPEEIQGLVNQAYEYAMETWPAAEEPKKALPMVREVLERMSGTYEFSSSRK